MSTLDDLNTIAADLNTLQEAVTTAVADLQTQTAADQVLEAAVNALRADGYTVTPPSTESLTADGNPTPEA